MRGKQPKSGEPGTMKIFDLNNLGRSRCRPFLISYVNNGDFQLVGLAVVHHAVTVGQTDDGPASVATAHGSVSS